MLMTIKRHQAFLLVFLFFTVTILGSCGGGDSGGGSETASKLTIDYPREGIHITALDYQDFKVTLSGSTQNFKASLNDRDITNSFEATSNKVKTALFTAIKGDIKPGKNTLKVSVSGYESRVNFTAAIANGSIIIMDVLNISSSDQIPQAGDIVVVDGVSNKEGLESVHVLGRSPSIEENAFKELELTLPDLLPEQLDWEPDFTFIAKYADDKEEHDPTHDLNLAVNGRQFDALGALQVNSKALNVMSPWIQTLIVKTLHESGLVLGQKGGNKTTCELIPTLSAGYDKCEITILGLGESSLSQEGELTPGVEMAVEEKPEENFQNAALQIGLGVNFDLIKTQFTFYKDGALEPSASVIATLPLTSGLFDARVLGYDNEGEGFGLAFPENKTPDGDYIDTFTFNLNFKNEDATLEACHPDNFCQGKSINLHDTDAETAIKGMVEPAMENWLSADARENFKKMMRFTEVLTRQTLNSDQSGLDLWEVILDNTIKAGMLSTVVKNNETNEEDDEAKHHAGFLTFGGGAMLFSQGEVPVPDEKDQNKEWVPYNIKPALGFLMTTNPMDFVEKKKLTTESGMSLAISANMLNQLVMSLYQSGKFQFAHNFTIEVGFPAGMKVPVQAVVTLESTPNVLLTKTNRIQIKASRVRLDLRAGEDMFPSIEAGMLVARATLDLEVDLNAATNAGQLALTTKEKAISVRIINLIIPEKLEDYRQAVEDSLRKDVPKVIAETVNNEVKKIASFGDLRINIANVIAGFDDSTKNAIINTLPQVYKMKLSDDGISVGNDATYMQFSGELEAESADDTEPDSIFSFGFCNNDSTEVDEQGCPGKIAQPAG